MRIWTHSHYDGFLFVDPEGHFGECERKSGSQVKIIHVVFINNNLKKSLSLLCLLQKAQHSFRKRSIGKDANFHDHNTNARISYKNAACRCGGKMACICIPRSYILYYYMLVLCCMWVMWPPVSQIPFKSLIFVRSISRIPLKQTMQIKNAMTTGFKTVKNVSA